MADFYAVHADALAKADHRIRVGQCWTIMLQEPLGPVALLSSTDLTITTIQFMASPDGKLRPARREDRDAIYEWNTRHRDTPAENFGLPSFMRN